MPPTETTAAAAAAAAAGTTLTTARQSSQLLQILRSVLQGSTRDLRRYLAGGGDPNARVYQAIPGGSFYVSSEEYTGPGTVLNLSLLAVCCFKRVAEQVTSLIEAGADPDSDTGTATTPMCIAASLGDILTMTILQSRGVRADCSGYTPLMA